MSFPKRLEQVVQAVERLDATDLPALVSLQDELSALAGSQEGRRHLAFVSACAQAAGAVEHLVMRDTDDVSATVQSVRQNIAQAQSVVDASLRGESIAPIPAASEGALGDAPATTSDRPSGEPHAGDERVGFSPDVELDATMEEFIAEVGEHLASVEEALLGLEIDRRDPELIATVFRAFHSVKAAAGFLGLRPIVDLTHGAESLLDLVRSGHLPLSATRIAVLRDSGAMLRQLVGILQKRRPPRLAELRSVVERTELAMASDVSQEVLGPEGASVTPSASSRFVDGRASDAQAATVRVRAADLDALAEQIGALQAAHSRSSTGGGPGGETDRALVEQLIQDAASRITSLRRAQIADVVRKAVRLGEHCASSLGKRVRFHVDGASCELDRLTVEALGNPLMHLVRNACDHGIEMPDDRVAAGKEPVANLWIRGSKRNGLTLVEIADDGRGLDAGRILNRARDLGLIGADRVSDSIPDHEVFKLIFTAGFSTARDLTETSGRGVGMDVVRHEIESVGGRIEIDTRPGLGCTFRIILPRSTA